MYNPAKPYIGKILSIINNANQNAVIPPASTDGIGTKGLYHWKSRSFRNAVLDSLAMNLNDKAIMRARVKYLHDHIFIPEDDEEAILEIVKCLADECKKRKIKIVSGETSIHDNMEGMDISISVLGKYVEKKPNRFREGDSLIGLASSGLHSNGFTKVRWLFGNEQRKEFIEPTVIYYDAVLKLLNKFDIHGMVHITGGAYKKIGGFLDGTDAEITSPLEPHKIFYELNSRGVSDDEMYSIFNCGTGFIIGASTKLESIILELEKEGIRAGIIGKVKQGNERVKIKSMFSDKTVIL